ncbi:MAG: aminotransferase class I/II-fold pyridoxal phosphate-dependent enzyme, partial [Candidatus Krumholzibacteria bacterium]|nr:aminotransferase class I/II-fold pyridoxal phosphate-dependent enzyme [Candidatus Krumholzibacteria bacterium]
VELLGKEAAVYVPSGTMSNALALLSQTRPGDEVILDRNCHIFNYEAASASTLGGIQLYPLDGPGGLLPIEQLPSVVRPIDVHYPRTSMVSVENTHNRAGGRIYPFDQLEEVAGFARGRGLRIHMDGARLANASVVTGIPFERYGALADSVTFSFSKGLGAPVGSILISDAETIGRARFWRKRLGGGMRQAGLLAAACLYSLDNNIERLSEDHEKAARIGEMIESSSKLKLTFPVETNIVIFETADDSIDIEEFRQSLEEYGVFALSFGGRSMRMVTHLDISSDDMICLETVMSNVLGS